MAAGAAAQSLRPSSLLVRSLKEAGTGGAMGGSVSCCSPARDCHTTDYETYGEGRYWIAVKGERIQEHRLEKSMASMVFLGSGPDPEGSSRNDSRVFPHPANLIGHPVVECHDTLCRCLFLSF